MMDLSDLLLAAFIFWAPASLLLALAAGAAFGRLRDDEVVSHTVEVRDAKEG
jgi:hypothetical protein